MSDDALTGVLLTREQQQRLALEGTYPGWEIFYVSGAELPWLARRRTDPTEAQRMAGLVATVSRSTGEALGTALGTALALLVEIAHNVRC
ncbi:hypothetical protein [Microtetraspora malaysiensis]|uniref:Uncharacterized protein n=1 Tax=Microtetraspora malaysiensis TaxID=161358 RepID=A0ABW6SMX6_9ACTN